MGVNVRGCPREAARVHAQRCGGATTEVAKADKYCEKGRARVNALSAGVIAEKCGANVMARLAQLLKKVKKWVCVALTLPQAALRMRGNVALAFPFTMNNAGVRSPLTPQVYALG